MTRSTTPHSSMTLNKLLDMVPELELRIEEYQRILRIQDWDVTISTRPPQQPGSLMEIFLTRRRKAAAIRLSERVIGSSKEELYSTLLHELVHIVFDEMDYEVNEACIDADFDRYEEARERAVDTLSKVLYSSISNMRL